MDNDKKEALIKSTQGVLHNSMEKPRTGELSDEELDNVAGGCGGTRECAFCGYPISEKDGWVCRSCHKQN